MTLLRRVVSRRAELGCLRASACITTIICHGMTVENRSALRSDEHEPCAPLTAWLAKQLWYAIENQAPESGREAEGGGLLKPQRSTVGPGIRELRGVHRGKTGCVWHPGIKYTTAIHNNRTNKEQSICLDVTGLEDSAPLSHRGARFARMMPLFHPSTHVTNVKNGNCRKTKVLAEREGFEPPIRFSRIPVFKTGAFNHSATSPEASRCENTFRISGDCWGDGNAISGSSPASL
jgi:hypothetical protein